jgi:hypothetical protein
VAAQVGFESLFLSNNQPDCMPFTEGASRKGKRSTQEVNLCLGKGTKVRRYLGGNMSLSFSEAGSPPMPQCVLGIS